MRKWTGSNPALRSAFSFSIGTRWFCFYLWKKQRINEKRK